MLSYLWYLCLSRWKIGDTVILKIWQFLKYAGNLLKFQFFLLTMRLEKGLWLRISHDIPTQDIDKNWDMRKFRTGCLCFGLAAERKTKFMLKMLQLEYEKLIHPTSQKGREHLLKRKIQNNNNKNFFLEFSYL